MFKKLGLLPWLLVILFACSALFAPISQAALPYKSAIKDARTILRYALPIENAPIRELQLTLEKMPRRANLKQWRDLKKEVAQLLQVVDQANAPILAGVISTKQAEAKQQLTELGQALRPLEEAIATKNRNLIKPLSIAALAYVGNLEAMMVQAFPFQIPEAYANLPQLKGRAIAEMETSQGKVKMVLDGYNAPITAGQFADLIQRGFYDNIGFSRADDNYFLQAGDPEGEAEGFVDPATGKLRTIPMEVKVPGEPTPIYGKTFAELGKIGVLPTLPFSAYGTLAMAHPNVDTNGGSSQFFIYLFESDLTPAGLNLIDGNYAAFGYVLDGETVLNKLKLEDRIISIRLVEGAENLIQPEQPASAKSVGDPMTQLLFNLELNL